MSDITKQDNLTIIKPSQDVVASMVKGLREELLGLVKGGTRELVIDLSDVEMVDSMGLGTIISTYNSLSKVGGNLKVTNVSKDVYDLFKAMRLDTHFEVTPVAG